MGSNFDIAIYLEGLHTDDLVSIAQEFMDYKSALVMNKLEPRLAKREAIDNIIKAVKDGQFFRHFVCDRVHHFF